MSHMLFQPLAGRVDEIMDFIMHTEEVSAYPDIGYAVRLACEEVIANIISYAYPEDADGYIEIDIAGEGNGLRIEICDGGRPFNPVKRQIPDVTQRLDDREIGGLGIYLILQTMDKVTYLYEEGRNKLVLTKHTSGGKSHD